MFTIMQLDTLEQGYYYMTRLGILLSMMNIRHVYHHGVAELYENTLYVYSLVKTDLENFRGRSWKREFIRVSEDAVRPCFDIDEPMEDMVQDGLYDILVMHHTDRPVAIYLAKENVIITSDLFHTTDCYNLTIETFSKLFKKIAELYPDKIITDTPSMFFVDMGDHVVDLRNGKKYPKMVITKAMKKEILDILKNDKSWNLE